MKLRIHQLRVVTKKTTEEVDLSTDVTFIHGPVSSGKSTTARLIDYCLGGGLERTPALRSEFVGVQLSATFGRYDVELDRGAEEGSAVRVTWDDGLGNKGALNAPLDPGTEPILGEDVFSLSDLIFHFCEVQPVKVRKSKLDPDSPMVRLSFRDLMWYCFLQQDELDSSFYQMQHPFKANKSRDVMRFVTGLHSERMNELESKLADFIQQQRTKREAVVQIRQFMAQFNLGSETEFKHEQDATQKELDRAVDERNKIDSQHKQLTHALEPIRQELRKLSKEESDCRTAIEDLEFRIQQQGSLRSELITAKVKASRTKQALTILGNVDFICCPRCNSPIQSDRFADEHLCCLCGQKPLGTEKESVVANPALNRDLDARIDDLTESVARHQRELTRSQIRLTTITVRRRELDEQLGREVNRYDSAYTSNARAADSKVSALQERLNALNRQAQMPAALSALETQAAALQADIDRTRGELLQEQSRLVGADKNIAAVAESFKEVMLAIGFPGVYPEDKVHLDPRNWLPYVKHGEQEWSFADAGSGGKKTLFNVCYALAVHRVALERKLQLPSLLIIDSPTKNITRDEDPELVNALYGRIFDLAKDFAGTVQIVLVDSHLVGPDKPQFSFSQRRMPPPLISYYTGP
jgi:hypothetical protein